MEIKKKTILNLEKNVEKIESESIVLFCIFKAAIKNLLRFKFFVRFPCPPSTRSFCLCCSP